MKYVYLFLISVGVASGLTGCVSSTQVQEMIDASNQHNRVQMQAHEDSISVLKQSVMTSLEKASDNTQRLAAVEMTVAGLSRQITEIQRLANASQVMSAENTVKVSGLEERVAANKEASDKVILQMADTDKLYEEVLIRQYQAIAESANAAIESLKKDGVSATAEAPVKLDEPIEIVVPDTTAPARTSDVRQ
jgi:hypothetical protein